MATACLSTPLATSPRVSRISKGGSYKPPSLPRAAGGAAGRRFCRIYPENGKWIVHLDAGAWPSNATDEDCRIPFHSLSAAIVYAVDHDLSYRVVHGPAEQPLSFVAKSNDTPALSQGAA